MIDEWTYNKAAGMYSHGQISFPELVAVIKGQVTLEQLENERSVA